MNNESADGLQQCVVTLLSSTIREDAEDDVKELSDSEEIWGLLKQ